MGMHIKEGRSFSKDFGADSTAIIFNEAAVKAMHLKDPVGKTVQLNTEHQYTDNRRCKRFSF